ncbi:uncharacterized protein si:ch1073-145m9.1 isoform X4 [Stegostoma tigrinum]|uniref:uncharacterized protein si:ch1073-145m9.1 isoform X4 n=2 Tax=Stegostoma tigrinum TaxID=3053191 RepID=UPI0028709342|nr:uncharacterized protein si:ch1073-145m9.1 isoform X4 [Stegostoma tigrinum]
MTYCLFICLHNLMVNAQTYKMGLKILLFVPNIIGFDGFAARQLNQVSEFGAWFDVAIDNFGRTMLWTLLFKWGHFVSSLEWCVFVCMHNSMGADWKNKFGEGPWWVRKTMANGACVLKRKEIFVKTKRTADAANREQKQLLEKPSRTSSPFLPVSLVPIWIKTSAGLLSEHPVPTRTFLTMASVRQHAILEPCLQTQMLIYAPNYIIPYHYCSPTLQPSLLYNSTSHGCR